MVVFYFANKICQIHFQSPKSLFTTTLTKRGSVNTAINVPLYGPITERHSNSNVGNEKKNKPNCHVGDEEENGNLNNHCLLKR